MSLYFGKEVTNNDMVTIQKRYSQNNLRLYSKYYASNIPEQAWEKLYDGKYMDEMEKVQKMENDLVTIVMSKNYKESLQFVYDIMKGRITVNLNCIRIDLFQLMSNTTTDFKINFGRINEESSDINTLVITGIRYGDLFNKYLESLMIFIDMFRNNGFKKNLILVLEHIKETEIEKAYGEFGEFCKNNTNLIML